MTVTRFRVGMAALLVLGIAALFAIVGKAQGPSLPPGEYDLEAGQYTLNQHPLSVLNLSVLDLSATPVPATDTPVPPTDTPVPSGHINTEWHLVSASISHEHGDDPSTVDHIFGALPDFLGGSISYPWQTPNENQIKHNGYKWSVNELGECINRGYHDTCVMAWRIQYHSVGGHVGATARFHSSFAQVKICTRDMQTCGTVDYFGGWQDFGCLSVLAANGELFSRTHVPLQSDPAVCKNTPYKHHERIGGEEQGSEMPGTDLENIRYYWNSLGGNQQGVTFAFTVHDDFQAIDINDPFLVEFQCPDGDCPYNHSLRFTYVVSVGKNWLRDLVPGPDNPVNFEGFVDRWGTVVSDCSIGVDCIPLQITNVPLGWAGFYQDNHGVRLKEYDLSPSGEWWIEYPN